MRGRYFIAILAFLVLAMVWTTMTTRSGPPLAPRLATGTPASSSGNGQQASNAALPDNAGAAGKDDAQRDRDDHDTPPVINPPQSAVVQGSVLDPNGRPIANAWVSLERTPPESIPNDVRPGSQEDRTGVLTGPDGRFILRRIPLHKCYLYAYHPDFAPAWVMLQPAPGEIIQTTLQLSRGGDITGVVLVGGRPAPGQDVRINDYHRQQKTTTANNGRFRFEHVPAGQMLVSADIQGRERPVSRTVIVEEGRTTQLEFTLDASSAQVVGMVSLDHVPIEEASLELNIATQTGELELFTARTDIAGAYVFGEVPPGQASLQVSFTRDGTPWTKSLLMDIPAGGVVPQDVLFDSDTILTVHVALPERVAGGLLFVVNGQVDPRQYAVEDWSSFEPYCAAFTGINGPAYRFAGLEPGTYTVFTAIFETMPPRNANLTAIALTAAVSVEVCAGVNTEIALEPR